jgi:hypothetical protein
MSRKKTSRRLHHRGIWALLDTATAGPRTVPVRSGPSGVKTLEFSGPPRPSDVLRAGTARAYSSSKVIHRWRGGAFFPSPQPTVSNFGGHAKMGCKKLSLSLNQTVEHAGSGRRIPRSNVTTFHRRLSLRDPAPCRKGTLRTFRLQVQTRQRRTSISASVRPGLRARQN